MSSQALKTMNIAVLLGGTSGERDVSLQSGRTVSDALQSLGYKVRDVDPADSDWMGQLEGTGSSMPCTVPVVRMARCKVHWSHSVCLIPGPGCWVRPWPWTSAAASSCGRA